MGAVRDRMARAGRGGAGNGLTRRRQFGQNDTVGGGRGERGVLFKEQKEDLRGWSVVNEGETCCDLDS